MKIYFRSIMIVQTVLTEMEFYKTIGELMENIIVKTSVAKEHVAENDKTIRKVKERTTLIVNTTPFKYLQNLLITNIVHFYSPVAEQPPPPIKMEDRTSFHRGKLWSGII